MAGTASTAALIVHKQTEFTRQFSQTRSTTFAATVANRFYSDNSLDRQRRIVECTKRRQARAREKAIEQEQELAHLQQRYEHKRQLHKLQSQRETSRMTRKLEHVAAAYIQHIYRTFVHRKRSWLHRQQVAKLLADFCSYQWRRRGRIRSHASFRIQQQWRVHKTRQRWTWCVRTLQLWIRSFIQKRRRERYLVAVRIQRSFRLWRDRRRRAAVLSIQCAWRVHSLWRRLHNLVMKGRRQRLQAYRDACARVLQRTIARFTWSRLQPRRPIELWENQRQILTDAATQAKRLQSDETRLRGELEALEKRIKESRERLGEERERLKRFHSWADVRRAKDDEQMREQLRDWESCKRFEIRMELEHELELERRAQLRTQQLYSRRASQDDDGRVEVS